MKDYLRLAIKGGIIGVANIIPGVSGGTLAITLGLYDKIIGAVSHFFKNLKDNLKLLIPIGLGAVVTIILLSKIIKTSLDKFPLATILLFVGLILGGMPILFKKVKHELTIPNITILLVSAGLVIGLTLLKTNSSDVSFINVNMGTMILLFLVGAIAAATMVIPGISGSFVLMLLGYYKPIITTISNLTDVSLIIHNMLILIPFGLGILFGIILIAKLIEYLLSNYEIKTYYGIIGFVISSVITIFMITNNFEFNIPEFIIGLILMIIGLIISYKLGEN